MIIKKNNNTYEFHLKFFETLIRSEIYNNYAKNLLNEDINFLEKNFKLIDEKKLFILIKKQKLIPYLHNNKFIKNNMFWLNQNIKKEAKIMLLKSLQLSLLTSEISSFLTRKKIKHLIIKGIPLSLKIYNDISKRGAGDLDILIDEKDLLKAIVILKEKGFKPYQRTFPLEPSSIWFTYSKWVYYEINLSRKTNNIVEFIDLHWRINNNRAYIPTFSQAWNSREEMILNNRKIYVPSTDVNLILITANAAKDRWIFYRNLIDLELFTRANKIKNINNFNKSKFFIMSIYISSKIFKKNNTLFHKKYFLKTKIADFISKYNEELSNIKSLKKRKFQFRLILFLYKLYLCQNANDFLSNILINILTPESIINKRNGKLNNFIFIIYNRLNSLRNLFK